MNSLELAQLCEALMYLDDTETPQHGFCLLEQYANKTARELGYMDWIDAYHRIVT